MDAITSYMSRRKGLTDAVSLNRDQRSLNRRAGSIGGVRNVGTDSAGRRVTMPTSAQISGGTAPPAFYRSMAPTRADRVRSAMADGSFGGIRSKFNDSQAGKQVMDPDGTIRAHNPYRDGGQLGGSQTATAPAPPVPTQPTPPAPVATKPVQQPAGPPAPGSRPGESLARTGVIRDETGDITNRIRSSMAGKLATPAAPAKPDPVLASAQKVQAAGAGVKSAETLIADTQRLINKTRAPQAVTPQSTKAATKPAQATPPAPTMPRPVDSTLTEPRGFGAKPGFVAPTPTTPQIETQAGKERQARAPGVIKAANALAAGATNAAAGTGAIVTAPARAAVGGLQAAKSVGQTIGTGLAAVGNRINESFAKPAKRWLAGSNDLGPAEKMLEAKKKQVKAY